MYRTGVAARKLGMMSKALYYYDECIRVAAKTDKHRQGLAKAYGYKGMLLFDWSQQEPAPLGLRAADGSGNITLEERDRVRNNLRTQGKYYTVLLGSISEYVRMVLIYINISVYVCIYSAV